MRDDIGVIKVKVYWAWWFPYYINTLLFFCEIFDAEPDYQKLERVAKRAVRVKT